MSCRSDFSKFSQNSNLQQSATIGVSLYQLNGAQLVDEVLQLQKHESFLFRCQKLEKMLKQEQPNKNVIRSIRAIKLPKICLQPQYNQSEETSSGNSSSEELHFNTDRSEKVIDTNKALVIAYSVRKLLLKTVKAF